MKKGKRKSDGNGGTERVPDETRSALINHLTSEIEQLSQNAVSYRTKGALVTMLGPYLVLGSIVVSSRSIDFVFDGPNVLALVAAGALFLVIGYVHGRIEAHMWNQCDRWRGMIAEIANAKVPINVPPERLQFAQALPKSYLWIFLAMLLPLLPITVFFWRRWTLTRVHLNVSSAKKPAFA